MHPEVAKFVEAVGTTKAEERFCANVRAVCRAFVQGEDFDDDALLKSLQPKAEAIWEFKLTYEPQHRILGAFLRKGEFVATNHRDRKTLARGFGPSRTRVKSVWSTLFPSNPRSSGARHALLEDFEHADV